MKFKRITKNIPTEFICMPNGKEFILIDFLSTVECFNDAPLDQLGRYTLNDYDVSESIAKELISMGLLIEVYGPRQAYKYEIVDKKKFNEFYQEIIELFTD